MEARAGFDVSCFGDDGVSGLSVPDGRPVGLWKRLGRMPGRFAGRVWPIRHRGCQPLIRIPPHARPRDGRRPPRTTTGTGSSEPWPVVARSKFDGFETVSDNRHPV